MPVTLNYHGAGIKADDENYYVGLGWSLFVGGYISRTVRGRPDEQQEFNIRSTRTFTLGNKDDLTYLKDVLHRQIDANYDRYNFRSNISARLSKYLTADINVSGRYDVTTSPIEGIFNTLFSATITNPTEPVYANGNSEYLNYGSPLTDRPNPVALLDGDLTGRLNKRNRSLMSSASLRFDVPWVEGLYLKGMVAYDAADTRETHERKTYKLYSYDAATDTYNAHDMREKSSLYLSMANTNRLNIQASIGYDNTFGEYHNVSGMMMYELIRNWNDSGSATREYDMYSKPIIDQGSTTTGLTNSGTYDENASISLLGRFNYDYRSRYLLEFAFRYSGSYRYAPEYRWGFFPVGSIGWRLSEEPFIKDNVDFINNIKLRASYGVTGVDAGDLYQWLEGFTAGANAGYEFTDGVLTSGVGMPSLVNRALTWQKSTTVDVGLDVTMWDGMFDLVFDLYQRDMTGIPTNPISQVTNTFGSTLPQINYNANQTRGIEFTLGHKHKIGDFRYEIAGNFNFARTRNTKVLRSEYVSSWDKWKDGNAVGRWTGIGWGYTTIGQFQSMEEIYNSTIVQTSDKGNTQIYPGDYYVEDTNGDGYIDGNDEVPMFYSLDMPALNYGLTLSLQWKNIDFYALFQGSSCYSLAIPDNLRNYAPWEGNSMKYMYDRWHRADPFDPDSEWIPGAVPSARNSAYMPLANNAANTDRNTVKGDYLRLKTLEIGYSIPKRACKFIGIESLRVYVNAYNVLSFYDSFLKNTLKVDPEKATGQDGRMLNYPLSSTVTFGINLNF